MSYNTLKRENKCWSCSHYSSERKIDKSLISGTGVRCDNDGKCTCSESENFKKNVSEYTECACYELLDSIARALAIEEKLDEMNRIEFDDEPANKEPEKIVEEAPKALDSDEMNRQRDLEFIRRSREIIKAREEEKIRKEQERIARRKKRKLALSLMLVFFSITLFLFVMVLMAVLYTPKRVIDRYLGQYDNHEYIETGSNSDYEYTFTFDTLTHGEYFDATFKIEMKDLVHNYNTMDISIIFTYGSDYGMDECLLVLYTDDGRYNLLFEFLLEECPNIKLDHYVLDYYEGDLKLEESDFLYCFNVVREFYGCIDRFLKKIDPSYCLWNIEI